MGTRTDEQIRDSLATAAESAGLLLEDVSTSQAGRRTVVRVTVDLPDGPGGVSSDQLADVTRAVSDALDTLDPFTGTYTLEVSTPGIDRPLTVPRHFRRAVGRKVELTTSEGTRTGRVTAADETTVTLDDVEVALDDISAARMVVDFGKDT